MAQVSSEPKSSQWSTSAAFHRRAYGATVGPGSPSMAETHGMGKTSKLHVKERLVVRPMFKWRAWGTWKGGLAPTCTLTALLGTGELHYLTTYSCDIDLPLPRGSPEAGVKDRQWAPATDTHVPLTLVGGGCCVIFLQPFSDMYLVLVEGHTPYVNWTIPLYSIVFTFL